MIQFDAPEGRFLYRAVAVIVRGDEVLLQQFEGQDFWCLPGGRIDLLEPAEEGVLREVLEELGVEGRVERLLWIAENFFEFRGLRYHESGMYFLVALPEGCDVYRAAAPWTAYELDGTGMLFQWHRLSELDPVPLKPSFLKTALRDLPEATTYVVHHDGYIGRAEAAT